MTLPSIANSIVTKVVTCTKSLNDASKLCFGAAIGCFAVGTIGWLVNSLEPGSTMLHGLLVVAVFYLALGVIKVFEKQASDSVGLDQNHGAKGPLLAPDKNFGTKEKLFKPAA